MRNVILVFILFLVSCSIIGPSQNPGLKTHLEYRKDMLITVNGKSFEGIGVVESADIYNFHIESRGQLDMFLFASCNREWMKERAWNVKKKVKTRLFNWGRKLKERVKEVQFEYRPIGEIEKTYCPVYMSGAEKKKEGHSWGFVDFRTPDLVLPAVIQCNGEISNIVGAGVCQSRKGKTQVIQFNDEMVVSPDASCALEGNRGTRFEFLLSRGLCVYRFTRIKRPHLVFRLTTFGYDKIPIRQE